MGQNIIESESDNDIKVQCKQKMRFKVMVRFIETAFKKPA